MDGAMARQQGKSSRAGAVLDSSFGSAPSATKSRDLAKLFHALNTHLQSLDIDYVLTYGTLLGWHRDGQPLPHDTDLDLAAPVAAFETIWASRSRLPAGFTMHDTSHRHLGPKLYVEYRGREADIYFLREEENGQLRTLEASSNPGDLLPYPHEWFFSPQPTVFLGESTFVPAQSLAYLEHIYHYLGPDAELDPVTRYYRPRQR
ncbi:MAG: hypothetical protein CMI16_08065 [Opitutaceae bacterium]|nr:hypothetical protein [Opitutaceae bacterium]